MSGPDMFFFFYFLPICSMFYPSHFILFFCFFSRPFNFVRDVIIYVFKLLVIKYYFFFKELFVRFRFGNIRGKKFFFLLLLLSRQMIYALTQSIFRCDVF